MVMKHALQQPTHIIIIIIIIINFQMDFVSIATTLDNMLN